MIVILVGESYHFSATDHSIYFAAVMDAYEKAQTLHRDVGLPNMIMYRPGVGERAGYLVDWELGCTLDKSAVHDHVLIVRLIFGPKWKPKS